jgi:hypothetical protein
VYDRGFGCTSGIGIPASPITSLFGDAAQEFHLAPVGVRPGRKAFDDGAC